MSLFSKILDKLGLHKEQPASAAVSMPPKPAATAPAAKKPTDMTFTPAQTSQTAAKPANVVPSQPVAAAIPSAPKAISEVDVVKQLEQKAKGTGLNWRVSIVDLLTLLDIDHSREARNELAKELGCPEEFMSDSAKMNTWLHKTVLKKIAENGGNIPQALLD
ncbi:MAG TPA: DUF3597 domain-containing protein [Anaerolineales bacterium]|nr:DUF3597 domain-containing protein [Anaerolineales bacterium]